MIELQEDELVFRFPDVHEDAVLRVDFQRTLRIPDDNRDYPLPPGLGSFPLEHVDDYTGSVPESWAQHGGVFFPMHQAEAMWISFHAGYPMAVKVAAGKINALTGGRWRNELARRPQDYLVVPDQPWLDGFCVRKGIVRQFVAMPLGEGYSAEEQLTGAAEHGGLQIIVYPMKASIHKKMRESMPAAYDGSVVYSPSNYASMGLAPGGLMRQEIFEDDYGFDAWDTSVSSRCFVHVLNSIQYLAVCGVGAAGRAAQGGRLHRCWAPMVRILRRRPEGPRGFGRAGGVGQRGREEVEGGGIRPRGKRPGAAQAGQETERVAGARGRVIED